MRVHRTKYEDEITLAEVEEAIKKLKTGKAAGTDNVKAEMVKYRASL